MGAGGVRIFTFLIGERCSQGGESRPSLGEGARRAENHGLPLGEGARRAENHGLHFGEGARRAEEGLCRAVPSSVSLRSPA